MAVAYLRGPAGSLLSRRGKSLLVANDGSTSTFHPTLWRHIGIPASGLDTDIAAQPHSRVMRHAIQWWRSLSAAHRRHSGFVETAGVSRSEEHTSELQSRGHLVCRLLLEK